VISRELLVRILRIAIILVILFNVFALLVLVHTTPIGYTLFMFFGQPLFVLAFVLLVAAILVDLKARRPL
jgi:hypothetical protein